MLYKLVVNKQIRMLETKEPLTLEALKQFMGSHFPHIKRFSFYYIDEDQDHINLDTNSDIAVYLENSIKKPKIFVEELEDEKNVFDSISHVIEPIQELKPPQTEIEKDQPEQQKKQEKVQEKPEHPQIQELGGEEQKEKSKQENNIIAHNIKCNSCEVEPIKGVRYQCSVCSNYDLCGKCIIGHKHDEDHPFVKIRDGESAPLEIKVEFQEKSEEKKQEKEQKNEEEKKEQKMPNKSVLHFENRRQKQVIIASYLQSVLGPEHSDSYAEFARQTNQNTKEEILENYLHWMERKQENPPTKKWMNWLKDKIQNTANSVGQMFQFMPNERQVNQNRPRNNQNQ